MTASGRLGVVLETRVAHAGVRRPSTTHDSLKEQEQQLQSRRALRRVDSTTPSGRDRFAMTRTSELLDLIVVGGRPAGLAAAVYAASEGLDVLAGPPVCEEDFG